MSLKLTPKKPKQSLNKSYLKNAQVDRASFDDFKAKLNKLLEAIDEKESEENVKNHLADFLKDTFYKDKHEINTKGRTDLVIHAENNAQSPVNILLEVKKPSNKNEMITKDNLNTKAMQELILYYLRERETENNTDIKYLIISNVYEFFIFEASDFEKLFHQNKKFLKDFKAWQSGKKSASTTDFFYTDIAKPFLENLEIEISATYFNIQDYQKALESDTGEEKLLALYKLFSPEHLLKTYSYDSNKLNQGFYEELLHIIGLEEVKEKGKKVIKRKEKAKRNYGSLLENTITVVESSEKIDNLDKPSKYGKSEEEQLFNISLELVITWINRVLFLKLLEGQLINFHHGNTSFKFLDKSNLNDFDDLFKLFFQVLAKVPSERMPYIQEKYYNIPYLNSSLFEVTLLEKRIVSISALDDSIEIPYFSKTVLVDNQGKREKGTTLVFDYLLRFLDAYDFSAEGQEKIQEHKKDLINASVLGLIFEKINGYKDGSFYTPGFITMYMARETLRKTVLDKFNEKYAWNCPDFESLRNYFEISQLKEYNDLINSIKVCDPAVGSGHFLVSVLNEFLAIKSDLRILLDAEGKRIQYYQVLIENDELSITDEYGEPFEYTVKYDNGERKTSKEKQTIQETIFQEKRHLIENCLFGVDINPNSVKICRLRLWIELLKHTYYKSPPSPKEGVSRSLPSEGLGEAGLEVLPNLDINIKQGNSLISKYALDMDLSEIFKKEKNKLKDYKQAVSDYKRENDRNKKKEALGIIKDIKQDFKTILNKKDALLVKINKLNGQIAILETQQDMFADKKKEAKKQKDIAKLQKQLDKANTEKAEREANRIFENAFEWRFEFPEVLNERGEFVGFDVVIGNPPYIQLQKMDKKDTLAFPQYKTYNALGDIYTLFYEKAFELNKKNGWLCFITSSKWMLASYGKSLREFFTNFATNTHVIDFAGYQIFDEATVDTNILTTQKTETKTKTIGVKIESDFSSSRDLKSYIENKNIILEKNGSDAWSITSPEKMRIRQKIESLGVPLKDWNIEIYRGILTGLNEAFVIDEEKKNQLIKEDTRTLEIIKPILRGRDIQKYQANFADLYLINSHNGLLLKTEYPFAVKEDGNGRNILIKYQDKKDLSNYIIVPTKRVEIVNENTVRLNREIVEEDYPVIYQHLKQFERKAQKRQDKGNHWTNLRNCAYIEEFDKEKIVWKRIGSRLAFSYSTNGDMCLDSTCILTGESIKYLLAFLNSKLCEWQLNEIGQRTGVGDLIISVQSLEPLPVPKISEKDQQPFIEKVEQILSLKKENPEADTSDLEAAIDAMVYELYGLTDEEIEIVEKQ